MYIKFKKRNASTLLISVLVLQLTVACLLMKIESFQQETKVVRQINNYYQKKINVILKNS